MEPTTIAVSVSTVTFVVPDVVPCAVPSAVMPHAPRARVPARAERLGVAVLTRSMMAASRSGRASGAEVPRATYPGRRTRCPISSSGWTRARDRYAYAAGGSPDTAGGNCSTDE